LGIDSEGQRQRIARDTVLSSVAYIIQVREKTLSKSGKTPNNMLTLPLEYLNRWLFGITDSKIEDQIKRERIIIYKKEVYKLIADYFLKSYAINTEVVENNIESITELEKILEQMRLNSQIRHLDATLYREVKYSIVANCVDYQAN
jgi:P22_AR N-terminal domain